MSQPTLQRTYDDLRVVLKAFGYTPTTDDDTLQLVRDLCQELSVLREAADGFVRKARKLGIGDTDS